MTDNEIIKALEVCASPEYSCECCLYLGKCRSLEKDALDLIKRQQAKIEKKDRILESYALQYGTAVDKERIIKAEVEKLHPYKLHYGNLRMEIAREVCDRLKAKAEANEWNGTICGVDIDNLLKEMEKECDSV